MSDKVKHFQYLVRVIGGISAPILILLTNYKEHYIPMILSVVVYLALSSFVRFKAFHSERVHKYIIFMDVLMLSIGIGFRGGIRSDFYLGYFLIMGYVILIPSKNFLLYLSGWITLNYVGTVYLFSSADTISLGRLFIRLTMLIGTSYLLRNFVNELVNYQEMRDNAIDMSFRDSLTNAYNRRILSYFSQEEGSLPPHSHLAIIDLDDFKQINDTYGHGAGDEVLIRLVDVINSHMKHGHICVRYGGEEFLLFFKDLTTKEVFNLIHDIQQNVQTLHFHWLSKEDRITFTAGVVESKPGLSLENEIKQADYALYDGKSAGKNCAILYDEHPHQALSTSIDL